MTLTQSEYSRISPQHRRIITHVANGGNTSDGSIWHILNQIKYELTGNWSRSDCENCKVDLFREFETALTEYENNLHSSKRQDSRQGNVG